RTNLKGLDTILELCRRANIRKFHHISTAYVAGNRKEFSESQCNEGQKFRNDYEQSKIEAEERVRNFGLTP
ncbi:MAG: SDR family oxidoreductase, partial [Thermoguttaceae bacterium]|nr:SDR family oxidoreductase [Thermoguttaceae bacterium]